MLTAIIIASTLDQPSGNTSSSSTSIDTVSQQIMEHLFAELVHYSAASTIPSGGDNDDDAVTDEQKTVAAEMSAAKLERIGYQIGYRLTERLAQTKTWNVLLTTSDPAQQVAAQQLEAVKFLCKEVWVQLFGKQIDKLQTNHRGVFVLKDLELPWLTKFPETEQSRVMAIQWLALPCGLIRGCLADLGIPSVVSCDFLADGQHMAACSFNIKVK
jgi:hypothetical protein